VGLAEGVAVAAKSNPTLFEWNNSPIIFKTPLIGRRSKQNKWVFTAKSGHSLFKYSDQQLSRVSKN
jgi:predicted nucleotidyltransferase